MSPTVVPVLLLSAPPYPLQLFQSFFSLLLLVPYSCSRPSSLCSSLSPTVVPVLLLSAPPCPLQLFPSFFSLLFLVYYSCSRPSSLCSSWSPTDVPVLLLCAPPCPLQLFPSFFSLLLLVYYCCSRPSSLFSSFSTTVVPVLLLSAPPPRPRPLFIVYCNKLVLTLQPPIVLFILGCWKFFSSPPRFSLTYWYLLPLSSFSSFIQYIPQGPMPFLLSILLLFLILIEKFWIFLVRLITRMEGQPHCFLLFSPCFLSGGGRGGVEGEGEKREGCPQRGKKR